MQTLVLPTAAGFHPEDGSTFRRFGLLRTAETTVAELPPTFVDDHVSPEPVALPPGIKGLTMQRRVCGDFYVEADRERSDVAATGETSIEAVRALAAKLAGAH